MKYIASLSCGKDSLAMVLKLMELERSLTHCVFYDAGMEYQSIYNNIEKIKPMLAEYGYEWCGGCTRWQTRNKVAEINNFLKGFDEYTQYIGIAKDEPKRIKQELNKEYPLVEWNMTEKDCLNYCYDKGYNWKEGEIELYDILPRVSCWCCKNKNISELRNYYKYMLKYWNKLKEFQSKLDQPMKNKESVFQLEQRFKLEEELLRQNKPIKTKEFYSELKKIGKSKLTINIEKTII